MNLKIKIDTAAIAAQFKALKMEVEQDLQRGVANLAAITHAKVAELASTELHSSRKTFMDSLGFEEVVPGVWVVSVDEKALWIEEGLPEHDMRAELLRGATKTSKDGHKYRAIKFDHGAPPSQLTGYAQGVVAKIRAKLRKEGVPFKKIEKNPNGSPRLGKLHTFDFGGEIPGRGNTPIMKNISIYQTLTKTGNVRRDVLTFRSLTSGPASDGKWVHPGMKAKKFLDAAAIWAEKEFYDKILPEILDKYK